MKVRTIAPGSNIFTNPVAVEYLEEFLKNKKFYPCSLKPIHSDYTAVWLEFANHLSDANSVYDFMIENEIGTNDPRLYISKAFFYEKYMRDFNQTELSYISGLKKMSDYFDKLQIKQEYRAFSNRMAARFERDIVPYKHLL
jgi:hypothetical protein